MLLAEEVTACFGPDYVISKVVVHFVADTERRLRPLIQNFWKSKAHKEMLEGNELALLKWAGIAIEPSQEK